MRRWFSRTLKAGDWVEVLTESEILATLDENGRRDGLPFMPEMLAFAGKRFRVIARADKTCDTITKTGGRRMRNTVHLETRCDGSAHGGCQASCLLFWNEAWIKRAGASTSPAVTSSATRSPLTHERLYSLTRRAPVADGDEEVRYRCQATELLDASSPLKWWDLRQYWRDWWSGNVSVGRIILVLARASFNGIQRWRGGGFGFPRMPRLTLTKTPTAKLGLKNGERVKVKSLDAIAQTLDIHSKNRGLWFDAEMTPFCGGSFEVEKRVEQIIDERTGKMLRMGGSCVMLKGVVCKGDYSHGRLLCPRQIPPYWREIWLERAEQANEINAPRSEVAKPDAGVADPGIAARARSADIARVPAQR